MRDVADVYQRVSIDTQFPGIVAYPCGPFNDYLEYNYQIMKCNVELVRVLQMSFTFSDALGNKPKGISTWRFNLRFDAKRDVFVQGFIESLHIDLPRHQSQGIEPHDFAELLLGTGLVLYEDVRWITYCDSGSFSRKPAEGQQPNEPHWVTYRGMYDFAHLLQLLTGSPLPDEARAFNELLNLFFPCRCDVARYLHRLPHLNSSSFRSAQHTMDAFFKLPDAVRRTAFDPIEEENVVHGISSDVVKANGQSYRQLERVR